MDAAGGLATRPWDAPQRRRLDRFNADLCADVHCHCLPGVDDGPGTVGQSLALCRALVADGITHAVATPHMLGRYEGRNAPAAVRAAVDDLQAELDAAGVPLVVLPGGDVRVDGELPRLLRDGAVLTVADGGRYVLLELPHDTDHDPEPLVGELAGMGVVGVLTHPERNAVLRRRPERALAWVRAGAVLQVTAGSLVGQFGKAEGAVAWDWVRRGLVQLIASDAHDDRRRPPSMTAAINALAAAGLPHVIGRRLCVENPGRIIRGEALQPARGAGNLAAGRVR